MNVPDYILLLTLGLLSSCNSSSLDSRKVLEKVTVMSDCDMEVRYVDDYVFPSLENIEGTLIGGLSGIDYHDGEWIVITDDSKPPIRFFDLEIDFDHSGFERVEVTGMTEILHEGESSYSSKAVDPESIRFMTESDNYIWSDEGKVNKDVPTAIRIIDKAGQFVAEVAVPNNCTVNTSSSGARNNGCLESLSLSVSGIDCWSCMELPLKQDGELPTINSKGSPVRMSLISMSSGKLKAQYAYPLEPLTRKTKVVDGLEINGVVEVLAINNHELLVLERAYAQGYDDGGNDVRLYLADVSNATDISAMNSLKGVDYTPIKKTLLLDFNDIRGDLYNGRLDNVEGICFGPDFKNGNRSLVLVTDDNFGIYGPQVNQFILLELKNP